MKKWLLISLLSLSCFAQTRFDASSQLAFKVANDGTTGTTVNQLAKANSSGAAVNAGTGDTGVPVFVVVGGAGTTGNASLAVAGAVTCKFDASGGTSGHYVQASTTTAGTCHDAGTSIPASGWIVGTLLSSPAANATGSVLLVQGFLPGGSGFTGGTLTSALNLAASTTGAPSFNIASGTAPTTPAAGDCWRDSTGINCVENTSNNGAVEVKSSSTCAASDANTVSFSADTNVAKVSENAGTCQEIVQLTKVQTLQGKTFSDFTALKGNALTVASDFTTAANTNLQTITGLTFTIPALTAVNIPFRCSFMYSQATATASISFGIQSATISPTNIAAKGFINTTAIASTSGNLPTLTTTTATAIVSGTPSAITTVWNAETAGLIENPSNASTNTVNFMIKTATSGDAVTIKRGSFCQVF